MVQVKICGLKTEETISAAINAGADYIGLVFFEKSPRHVTLSHAAALAAFHRRQDPDRNCQIVALTVDASDDDLNAICESVSPDIIQCHGTEDIDRIHSITALTRCDILKAFKIRDTADVKAAQSFGDANYIPLFDAKAPEDAPLPGGNGDVFDWTLLKNWQGKRPFMLGGGLNISNIAQAVIDTGADILDVSSGVEAAPGVKSSDKIMHFIQHAKSL